jgi:hypothetical protein
MINDVLPRFAAAVRQTLYAEISASLHVRFHGVKAGAFWVAFF